MKTRLHLSTAVFGVLCLASTLCHAGEKDAFPKLVADEVLVQKAYGNQGVYYGSASPLDIWKAALHGDVPEGFHSIGSLTDLQSHLPNDLYVVGGNLWYYDVHVKVVQVFDYVAPTADFLKAFQAGSENTSGGAPENSVAVLKAALTAGTADGTKVDNAKDALESLTAKVTGPFYAATISSPIPADILSRINKESFLTNLTDLKKQYLDAKAMVDLVNGLPESKATAAQKQAFAATVKTVSEAVGVFVSYFPDKEALQAGVETETAVALSTWLVPNVGHVEKFPTNQTGYVVTLVPNHNAPPGTKTPPAIGFPEALTASPWHWTNSAGPFFVDFPDPNLVAKADPSDGNKIKITEVGPQSSKAATLGAFRHYMYSLNRSFDFGLTIGIVQKDSAFGYGGGLSFGGGGQNGFIVTVGYIYYPHQELLNGKVGEVVPDTWTPSFRNTYSWRFFAGLGIKF